MSPATGTPNQFGRQAAADVPGQVGQAPTQWSAAPTGIHPDSPTGASLGGKPRPGRTTLPGWAIALIALGCAGAILLAVMIAVAVAIPLFLNQRHRAALAATTVTMPQRIDGIPRDLGPDAQE